MERRRGGEAERRRGGEAERRRGGEVERRRGGEVKRWRGGGQEERKENHVTYPGLFTSPTDLFASLVARRE